MEKLRNGGFPHLGVDCNGFEKVVVMISSATAVGICSRGWLTEQLKF